MYSTGLSPSGCVAVTRARRFRARHGRAAVAIGGGQRAVRLGLRSVGRGGAGGEIAVETTKHSRCRLQVIA